MKNKQKKLKKYSKIKKIALPNSVGGTIPGPNSIPPILRHVKSDWPFVDPFGG